MKGLFRKLRANSASDEDRINNDRSDNDRSDSDNDPGDDDRAAADFLAP